MNIRKLMTSGLVTALALGVAVGSAFASESITLRRASQQFDDMTGYEWALSKVTRLQVKGVLRGQEEHRFAPGAKVTRQEAAVATVRLMGADQEALALAPADVDALLKDMPDAPALALWARNAVALLIQRGAVNPMSDFYPEGDATRLEVSVLLVKALGYEAEAKSKMQTPLSFTDADQIPATQVGYVATAIDHRLINGYEDRTFRPGQGVKRVELAVILGRADVQGTQDISGTIQSVDPTTRSFFLAAASGQDMTLTLSDDAAIFVDNVEVGLDGLRAGMPAIVTLNPNAKAVVVEAQTPVPAPPPPVQGVEVRGEIITLSAAVPGTPGTPARISLGGISDGSFFMTTYDVPDTAPILLNGQTAQFTDLQAGDQVVLLLVDGVVSRVTATR